MLKAATVFGDNMVLQRQKEIMIWGTGEPERCVTCTLTGEYPIEATAAINVDGNWSLAIPS